MRLRTLAACLLWTAVAMLLAVGPELLASYQVWSHAGEYELKDFVVSGSECRGGERVREAGGRWRTTPRRCWYEGTIDGRRETFDTGASLPGDHGPGAVLKVWFDPETYETGLGGASIRLRWYEDRLGEDDLGRRMGRTFGGFAVVLAVALLGVVLLDRLYRARLPGRGDSLREPVELDLGGGIPVLGIPFVAIGAALLLEPLATWSPPTGRWLFGVLGVVLGAGMLARRTVRLAGEGTVLAGWSWLGFSAGARPLPAAAEAVVRVVADGRAGAYEIRTGGRRLGMLADGTAAAAAAERIGQALGRPVELAGELRPRRRRLSMAAQLAAALVLTLGGALLVPSVRERAYLASLSPDGPPSPQLRRFAARQLAAHPTPESIERLVQLVNTSWQDFPELAAEALVSLERIARRDGAGPDADPADSAWVNPWAAERLGRELDDNGGVLGWYPVAESLRAGLDALASPDPEIGAAAWSLYGAGVITSPGELLLLSGTALGDPRPIHFALLRDAEGEGGAITALSDPRAASADQVLARTVGEAIALRYWLLLAGRQEALAARTDRRAAADLARLEIGDFPADFGAWWADHSRRHRLPPLPGQRPIEDGGSAACWRPELSWRSPVVAPPAAGAGAMARRPGRIRREESGRRVGRGAAVAAGAGAEAGDRREAVMRGWMGNGLVLTVLALCAAEASAAVTPVAVSPGGATSKAIDARCPSFDWAGVAGAEWYDLVVYRVGGGVPEPDPVLAERIAGRALGWTPALDLCLERGTSYAWSVQAITGGEASGWSEPLFFDIVAPLPAEVLAAALEVVRRHLAAEGGAESGGGRLRNAEREPLPSSPGSRDPAVAGLAGRPGEPAGAPSRISATSVGHPTAKLTVTGEVRSVDAEGDPRLWGRGRPGIVVHGPGGIGGDSCTTLVGGGGVGVILHYGLSNIEVDWASAADACPAGTWVCTGSDLVACDTDRPDDSSDGLACDGSSNNNDADSHSGWVAGTYEGGMATHGRLFTERGHLGHASPCYRRPVWCCW